MSSLLKFENLSLILKTWTEVAESSSVSGDRALRLSLEKADTLYIIFFILPPSAPPNSSKIALRRFSEVVHSFPKAGCFYVVLEFFPCLFCYEIGVLA